MLLMKVFKHDALDKLTTGSGALSNLAGEAVLDDLLSNARKESGHFIVDFDRMKHAWLEEDIQYVLDTYEVEELEELDDMLYMLTPSYLPGKVLYMHFDEQSYIEEI